MLALCFVDCDPPAGKFLSGELKENAKVVMDLDSNKKIVFKAG